VPPRPGQSRHASDNREELSRAAAALRHAADGANVAVVSGGDPGVFAMAAAICEAIEAGPESWRALDVAVIPGITAMLAVAARIGAPLGHDFCAISLSDNLKPWDVIERRLDAAAGAGFVIALYNPVSRARPWQFGQAIERLRRHLPPQTPLVFGRAVGRPNEQIDVVTLEAAGVASADMATLVIVGSRDTRVIARPGRHPLVYTPRAVAEVSA
jgi:precorrin-3B C17-methyltransferase / cobalt-factor III methyltransferase